MASSGRYPQELLNGLNKLREQDQLCDIIVCVGGKSFPAHKAVLAATGDYFLAMFTSGFKESSENKITIDGSAEAFKILLEFAYTGQVQLLSISTCIFEVFEMACYTQFTRFAKTCASAIERVICGRYNIPVSDVCNVMLLAEKHRYLKLHEVSLRYLDNCVGDLKSLDVFLEYTSMTLLQSFLSRDNLSKEDEEVQVLELVINWLKHDWEKRKKYSHQLLQKVRLALVDTEDIKELIGQEILDIPECLELVNHVLQLQASKKPRDVLSIENPEIAATRSTITAPLLSRNGKFQFYAADNNNWIALDQFAPLPSESATYSMVVVDNILYTLGGDGGTEFYRYQVGANKWWQLPSMPERQNFTKLLSLGDYIYAVGIHRGVGNFRQQFRGPGIMIKRYDITEKKWEPVEPPPNNYHYSLEEMNHKIRHAADGRQAISVLVFEGKIFVSSVRACNNEGSDKIYEEFMMYDPEIHSWQESGIRQRSVVEDNGYTDPVLQIYKGQLFRVIDNYIRYNTDGRVDADGEMSDGEDEMHYMTVNRLIPQSGDDGTMIVKIARDRFHQDSSMDPVFYIGDMAFIIAKRIVCVYSEFDEKSNVKLDLEPGNVCSIPAFEAENLTSAPVWFTFDRKKLSK